LSVSLLPMQTVTSKQSLKAKSEFYGTLWTSDGDFGYLSM